MSARRTWIATLWLFGTIVPAVVMAVFLFGCCVLPFHNIVHRVMPFCGGITGILASGTTNTDHTTTIPAKAPLRFDATHVRSFVRIAAVSTSIDFVRNAQQLRGSLRAAVRFGALRCDQDVGLHLLLAVLLI